MRIAIIGAGAAGMISAHYLNNHHEIHIFEKNDYIGGTIRTIGKNIKTSLLPPGAFTENGVLGFHESAYPNFCKFLRELDVATFRSSAGANLLLPDHSVVQLPLELIDSSSNLLEKIGHCFTGIKYKLSNNHKKDLKMVDIIDKGRCATGRTVGDFLTNDEYINNRLKTIVMLSYSVPEHLIPTFPADVAFSHIYSVFTGKWLTIDGGVYTYIEKILSLAGDRIKIHLEARIDDITRDQIGVKIRFMSGETLQFDKVIFATPPAETLKLLADPREEEKRRFFDFSTHDFETIAHNSDNFYRPFKLKHFTSTDYFVFGDGSLGYNTYLNNAYKIPKDNPNSFSYNLGHLINSNTVIDKFTHKITTHNLASMQYRREISETNGSFNTYHVGSYLGNCLHEGAYTSAKDVVKIIL